MDRRPLVYLHGIPGSPDELELSGPAEWRTRQHFYAPDRNLLARQFAGPDQLAMLDQQIGERFGQQPVRLAGFSLGAAIALRLARRIGQRVAWIDLIAPAAPLALGDFLGEMAGGSLFKLARDHPRRFALACKTQGLAAAIAPQQLARAILAGCAGEDAELARQSGFRQLIARMLKASLSQGAAAYRSEILSYVQDWSEILPQISAPVEIWQGDRDTWVPPAMTTALAARLPNVTALHSLPGLSHYSALAHYLEHISPGDNLP